MKHKDVFLPKTEKPNPLTADIDTWPIVKILEVMNQEDHKVAPSITREIPVIEKAVELVVKSLSKGGRLFYAGAGTSGRLGVLDSAELEPTFGLERKRIIPIISGGKKAVFAAVEGAEDKEEHGKEAFLAHDPGQNDVVIGISASGKTPFVTGVMKAASSSGLSTIAIVGDPQGPVSRYANVVISPDVGPEIIAGSTRLKNGTAQKMVLNMISTASMIALGRTYSNLMAGTYPGNQKLSSRARRILQETTGKGPEQIETALKESDWDIPVALIMLISGLGTDDAKATLKDASGSIRRAVKLALEKSTDRLLDNHTSNTLNSYKEAGCPLPVSISAKDSLCFGSSENSGFNHKRLELAFSVVQDTVGDGQGPIPGAVAAVARNGIVIGPRAWGWASRSPQRIPVTPNTIFDMASLTKVMATTPSILILCERGALRLDDPISLFLPEFGAGGKQDITIRHLMTHTSGLPAHIKFWEDGLKGQEIIDCIYNLKLERDSRPGTHVEYSDLGFILLGEVVRQLTGLSIKEFSEQEVFKPLGMTATCFLPPESLKYRIAATEFREDLGHVVWGRVHDENAYALGGVAGHAGLFSTMLDTVAYGLMWLNRGCLGSTRILGRKTVAAAIKEQANLEERRGLGWQLKSRALSSGGDFLSDSAFGHTGFTGTSLWCDPEENLAVVLLTNRVHAGREGNAHIRLRARFANAVSSAIEN
ncbi:MAG TPA: N-acetylmuramic acid 6-phosphate etherase [Firmicutes bacterium]|nr:N-acetylmuramic acid 6-phosphate etherase [Bacillota bacterium]